MKKIFLLACTLLLLALHHSQAAPFHAGTPTYQLPVYSIKSSSVMKAGLIRLELSNNLNAAVTTIYARMQYENEYQSGPGLYCDVVVRFFEDAEQEIPAYVFSLTVNFRVIGYNGYNGYDFNDSMIANGEYLTIVWGNEHDYDDGETFRFRDYHLRPGDYESL